ncbi:hypothetical protein MTO96_045335 [Rhipicephalus appendiculatus]
MSQASVGVRSILSQLELQKFDGNRIEWHQFWMQFSTAVHSNEDSSAAEKFNYLSTLVTVAAAAPISGLKATGNVMKAQWTSSRNASGTKGLSLRNISEAS